MSSGFFPLGKTDIGNGQKLMDIANRINSIRSEMHDYSCQDNNGEDATSDGYYLAYLEIASDMIIRCLK